MTRNQLTGRKAIRQQEIRREQPQLKPSPTERDETTSVVAFCSFGPPSQLALSKFCGVSMSGLSTVHAVVLGLVEGVTEFLPISSTGHLIVAERLLKLPSSEALDAYTVIIQIGAIAAVVGLYWQRMVSLLQGLLGRSPEGRRLLLALIVAFLPAGIVGAALSKKIDAHLLNPRTVVVAWIVGGAILLKVAPLLHGYGRPRGTKLEALTARQAGIIGEAQILALIPGTSRSLVTIIAAVLVGLSLAAAVEFSFLLGLVTLTAATVFKLVKKWGRVHRLRGSCPHGWDRRGRDLGVHRGAHIRSVLEDPQPGWFRLVSHRNRIGNNHVSRNQNHPKLRVMSGAVQVLSNITTLFGHDTVTKNREFVQMVSE